MRIARWTTSEGAADDGFVIGDGVVAFPEGATVADVLDGGLEAAADLHNHVVGAKSPSTPLTEVTLRTPLIPASVRDFSIYEEHVEGVSASVTGRSFVAPEWYEGPTFYFGNPHTMLATGDAVQPPPRERLGFGPEPGGAPGGGEGDGRNLGVNSADTHIFGYPIMIDWSARDVQGREMKNMLGPAKGKDFGTTLGPWIVTADELAPYLDADGFLAVRAEAYVNGVQVGADLVSNMAWTFPAIVSYASRNSRVRPGDVLGAGTVGNGGCLAELWGPAGELTPPPLREGDEVRLVVEGVGEIVNTIGGPLALPSLPRAASRPRSRHRDGEE